MGKKKKLRRRRRGRKATREGEDRQHFSTLGGLAHTCAVAVISLRLGMNLIISKCGQNLMQTQLNNIQLACPSLSPKSRANVREHAALLLVSCCRTNEACINEDICSNAGGEVREGGGGMDRKWRCFQRRIEQAECSSMIGFLFLQSKDKIRGRTYLSRKQTGLGRKFSEGAS